MLGAVLLGHSHAVAASDRDAALSTTVAWSLDGDPLKVALAEAQFAAAPGHAVGMALAHVATSRGSDDTQFRVSLASTHPRDRWRLDARHMISAGTTSDARYRLRLRVIVPLSRKIPALTIRAHDELVVDLSRGKYLRTNLALGLAFDFRRATVELGHYRQLDPGRRDARFTLALVTLRHVR